MPKTTIKRDIRIPIRSNPKQPLTLRTVEEFVRQQKIGRGIWPVLSVGVVYTGHYHPPDLFELVQN